MNDHESSTSPVAQEHEFSFDEYLKTVDQQTRQKILGKRDYFFKDIPRSTREQIQMDEEASYSVTEMRLAQETSEMIARVLKANGSEPATVTITDATACVGGNTISFASHFHHVNAVELDNKRFSMLRSNVNLLCKSEKVTLHLGDSTSPELRGQLTQDVVFFDPPWGGVGYDKQKTMQLFMSEKPLAEVCRSLRGQAKYIVLKVPHNFGFDEFVQEVRADGSLEVLERKEMGRFGNRPAKFVIMVLRVQPPQTAAGGDVPAARLWSRAALKRRAEDGSSDDNERNHKRQVVTKED